MYYAQQDLGIGIGLKDLDEFSENLQMSFDPPAAALVSKNYVALFFGRYRNLQRYISDRSDPTPTPLSKNSIKKSALLEQ